MVFLSKKFVFMLVFAAIVSGLLLVEPCMAPVTVPAKPNAGPDIVSVEVHHHPQTYSPSYTTDPYTGNKYQTSSGGITQGGEVVIKIKNQPFTAYTDKNGNTINRYYSFFWQPLGGLFMQPYCVYQSDSAYTLITFLYGSVYNPSGDPFMGYWMEGGFVVFRVQAVEGYFDLFTVFEGEGSEFVEFTVNIPAATDKSGTTKPDIKPSSTANSDAPSISDPSNTPPPDPWPTYLPIIATICIVTIPLVIIAYNYGQRKTKLTTAQTTPSTTT